VSVEISLGGFRYALSALYLLGQDAIRKLGEIAEALRKPPDTPPASGDGSGTGSKGGIRDPPAGRHESKDGAEGNYSVANKAQS
jgi:hypothetical protein